MKASGNDGVYGFSFHTLDGKPRALKEFEGKVLLIVNVASKCGLTPQYADLQLLYDKYKTRGLEILGFPANNFGAQEPGTHEEIHQFCTQNYGVTFPMFEKISVSGEDMNPLYKYLTEQTHAPVKWNFQKFLVDKTGKVVQSFEPTMTVEDSRIIEAIEALL